MRVPSRFAAFFHLPAIGASKTAARPSPVPREPSVVSQGLSVDTNGASTAGSVADRWAAPDALRW